MTCACLACLESTGHPSISPRSSSHPPSTTRPLSIELSPPICRITVERPHPLRNQAANQGPVMCRPRAGRPPKVARHRYSMHPRPFLSHFSLPWLGHRRMDSRPLPRNLPPHRETRSITTWTCTSGWFPGKEAVRTSPTALLLLLMLLRRKTRPSADVINTPLNLNPPFAPYSVHTCTGTPSQMQQYQHGRSHGLTGLTPSLVRAVMMPAPPVRGYV